MQIKVTTDYAIRMVVYMALHRRVISSNEISEKLKIPQSIALKIGKKLSKEAIASIIMGPHGGLSLRRRPDEITLLDIICLFEPTIKLSRCLEEDEYCSRNATEDCPVRRFYCGWQDETEERLRTATIQSLIEP